MPINALAVHLATFAIVASGFCVMLKPFWKEAGKVALRLFAVGVLLAAAAAAVVPTSFG